MPAEPVTIKEGKTFLRALSADFCPHLLGHISVAWPQLWLLSLSSGGRQNGIGWVFVAVSARCLLPRQVIGC